MEKPNFKKLLFLNIQQLTNFPYIEEDFDALTDYGLLCKVVEKMNEVISNNNIQNETINTLYENMVALKEYVDTYLVDVDDIKEKLVEIDGTLNTFAERISQNEIDIGNVRVDMTSLINETYDSLKAYVDYQDSVLDEKITNIEIGEISVYNPTNGLLQPLQTVINDLYGAGNKDGLSATEFDALDLTASEFDAYNITAYEFDSNGKTILV